MVVEDGPVGQIDWQKRELLVCPSMMNKRKKFRQPISISPAVRDVNYASICIY
jgi:hypothetical protein